MESTLQRCRRVTIPNGIPRSAAEALEALNRSSENRAPERFTRFVQSTVTITEGKAVIFYSESIANVLEIEQREGPPSNLEIDGTFSVVPIQDGPDSFCQLLCLVVLYRGTMMPCGFALMSSKRQPLYARCLEALKQGLGLRPTYVTTGF